MKLRRRENVGMPRPLLSPNQIDMSRLHPPTQNDFFQEKPVGPPGFAYRPDVINVAEEARLIERIAKLPLAEFKFQQYLAKRRVIYFGWCYDFEKLKI